MRIERPSGDNAKRKTVRSVKSVIFCAVRRPSLGQTLDNNGVTTRGRDHAAKEYCSAALNQSAVLFHLGKIWATNSKLLILND